MIDTSAWARDYDRWKTSPPEEEESAFKCTCCDTDLWTDDKYMEIEGEIYCEECARDWFESQWQKVTDEQCCGER